MAETKYYKHNGETHTLREWAEITGIESKTIQNRIHVGHWSVERALTTPTSVNHEYELNGEKHTLREWSEITGIPMRILEQRRYKKWSVERMLTEPVNRQFVRSGKGVTEEDTEPPAQYGENSGVELFCTRGADGTRACYGPESQCYRCGFEVHEAERRKALPLVLDEDGLYRKHVGVHNE